MNKAISQANKALLCDEIPIGAAIVDNNNNEIISLSHNMINTNQDATKHAEIVAINESCKKLGKKYLSNTSIFITLEPCMMCTAAIREAHIDKVYFGAYDDKKVGIESIIKILKKNSFLKPEVYGGINELECSNLIKNFFKEKRL
tara:strand:+ start:507 stop:941 length:435 start_codon:yes stop_codon:yes gene_type:complete